MKDINKYRGIIPAFYACYAPDGSISTEGVKALTRHLIAKGVKGVYVGGSSGECIYQHPDERKAVLEAVMSEAKGKITVIAHVACNNTADSVELAAHAEKCLFGVICCPLGLWWSVRNYLRFGVKPNYVPSLSNADVQYIGDLTAKHRLTDFSFSQIKIVFEQWGGESYKEYNPTIAMLKNSIFGEGINETFFPKNAMLVPYALFWIALVLAVIAFIAMLIVLFVKTDNARFTEKLMLTVVYATILGNYYNFCIKYPFICTMNFRYIIPCMLIGLINIGLFTDLCNRSEKAPCKAIVSTLSYLSSAFIVLSYITYFFVASTNG